MAHVNPIQIQKFLKGVDYPASKGTLIENAKKLGADETVFASLEQLPDEEFETPADVSKAFGQLTDEEPKANADADAGSGQADKAPGQHAARKPARAPARETGDNEFLAHALQDAMAEIQMSELALEKTASDAIKSFAQTMIDEHGELGRDIEKLAEKKKLTLPQEVRAEHDSAMKSLNKLRADKFDRAYLDQVLKDHENDLKVFRHYATEAEDADAKQLAKHGEKMMNRHLKMVKELDKKI